MAPMEVLGLILTVCGFILVIVLIVKGVLKSKQARRSCPECKQYYFYEDDITMHIGDLKWEKKTKEETKGDFTYEITYKLFYRIVDFDCKCSKCGHERTLTERFDVYSSDSSYSQSAEEEEAVLLHEIEKWLGPQAFDRALNNKKNAEINAKRK